MTPFTKLAKEAGWSNKEDAIPNLPNEDGYWMNKDRWHEAGNPVTYITTQEVCEGENLIERAICKAAIEDVLEAGYAIRIYDGEEIVTDAMWNNHALTVENLMKAMESTDEDYLFVYEKGKKERFGWVRFVYGNGSSVISDYTTNLETVLNRTANDLANALDERI